MVIFFEKIIRGGKIVRLRERNVCMKIYHSVAELIGKTPLLELCRMEKNHGLSATLLAKLEGCNPAGSAKDRIALEMIAQAEAAGILTPGATIVEPTSGNTGIGLAALCAAKGYRLVITMPETMSAERRNLMKAYGAELVLTEGSQGMAGAIRVAEEIVKNDPKAMMAGQFVNPANPDAHRKTTGPEIWEDTDGQVDILIAGIGTGGTLTGTGEYLREKNPALQIIGVEPANSPLLTQGKAGSHGLQGIGANFVPEVLNTSLYDEILTVTEADAYATGREMAQTEGFLIGISGGAALWAALQVASRPENAGKTIVVILPDSGERYLSTPLFSQE